LYDVEDSGQQDLVDVGQVQASSNPKKKFEGFKV